MSIRLIESGWNAEFLQAARADSSRFRIISPFIKIGALERLLRHAPKSLQVITRFNLSDFVEGVSDLAALRRIMYLGGEVRGIKNLHAKIYLFGSSSVIVTSANLTQAAFDRNQEFGFVSKDRSAINVCGDYFKNLWQVGAVPTTEQLTAWEDVVGRQRTERKGQSPVAGLGDYGADAGIKLSPSLPLGVAEASQAYVKFLGEAKERASLSLPTIDEIDRASCHKVVAYPANKRPRRVQDGAVMFIGRLTHSPNDIRVFGRAIGKNYEDGKDDASPADIARREWKKVWPRYIRLRDAEFLDGTLENAISLNELMDALGSNAFLATQRNVAVGVGNTDPRRAYRQQAAVELSDEGRVWLSDRLQAAFELYGRVSAEELEKID